MKRSIIILLIISILFSLTGCKNRDNIELNDKVKFKQAYEELNLDLSHKFVNISEDNPIKYISPSELYKLVEANKTFSLFIGNSKDETSRIVVESLLTSAQETKINTLYYLDVSDIEEIIDYNSDEKKLYVKKTGTEDYYKIANILENYLDNYVFFSDSDGKITLEKKQLYTPTLVAFSYGSPVGLTHGFNFATIKNKSDLSNLSSEALIENFNSIFKMTKIDTCVIDEAC